MKQFLLIVIAIVSCYFLWEPVGEWKDRVKDQRSSFNQTADELFNESKSNGYSVLFIELRRNLFNDSANFISLLNSKPYGLPLTSFESELLENAKETKIDMAKSMDADARANDPNNDPPAATPTPTPVSASTPRSIFPAGVDTPEQRRAYLQELANERKNQRQSPNEQ